MKKILALFFACLFLTSCKVHHSEALRPVEYEKVKFDKIKNEKIFFGFIKGGNEGKLSFRTSGQIIKIFVLEGDTVHKGQLLAILDNEEDVLEAREAYAKIYDAEIQHRNAKRYFERIDKLHGVGGVSEIDWENASTNMISRENQIKMAKEVFAVKSKQITYGKIYAPSDGMVIERHLNEGDYAQAGDEAFTLEKNVKNEAKVYVSQKYIDGIRKGQMVKVTSDALEGKVFFARVKSISETSVDKGSYRITLIFEEKYRQLKDGMSISAEFDYDDNKEEIILPVVAVLKENGVHYVWTLENAKRGVATVHRKNVTTGEIDGNRIVIKSGLVPGEIVAKKGVSDITEGQKVRLYNENE